MTLPAGARRLFAHYPLENLDLGRHEPLIVERLFEDGDRRDLRWLAATVPEARLAAWFRERASRRLSGRSRAFWSIVLDVAPQPPPGGGDQLWPL